ncbi:GGDEF domain-containing protein [Salinicola halimionae]|uniref:GGDEF domain-containing protein n=1 Tax=Salinicola halimionae TaxID=1949081 RepID=UPI0013007050|nr:GGDEF domain-containing protein [Salinicola halimionae]
MKKTIGALGGIWLCASLLMCGAAWQVTAGQSVAIIVLLAWLSGLLGLGATLWLLDRQLLIPVKRLTDHVRLEHDFSNTPQEMPVDLLQRLDAVGSLARQLQTLIEESRNHNAALLEQTLNDPLTGLGNRRLLESRLDMLIPLSRRLSCTVSAMMIDVDHFKPFNDNYGHPAGDACLVDLAGVLKDTFRRETDVVVRLGGEEFLVLLINIDEEEAWTLADAMRGMIQALGLPHEYSPVADVVTVSVGVVTSPNGLLVNIDDMIAHADQALYECKAQGRNRVAARLIGAHPTPPPYPIAESERRLSRACDDPLPNL